MGNVNSVPGTKTKRRPLNALVLSVRESTLVRGYFVQVRELLGVSGEPITSKKYGNKLEVMELRDPITKDILLYWADGGLRGALKMARVEAGQGIEIEHTGEKQLPDGGTVQTYNIYPLDATQFAEESA